MLKYLFPDFPISLILIADTKKPYLENEVYHFSISHCGDFAAAIVSKTKRVGVDIEIPTEKVLRIAYKFLHPDEKIICNYRLNGNEKDLLTILWSSKEAMFKWWGKGSVDFSEMLRVSGDISQNEGLLSGQFIKDATVFSFPVHYRLFEQLVLTWVQTEAKLF